MTSRFLLRTFGLVAVLTISACSPSLAKLPGLPTPTPLNTELVAPAASEATNVAPNLTQKIEIQAVATSRGPDLEATDPSTVSLASGQLQLLEFFRFTWSTCRAMAPMVHGLEAEYFGRVKFSYLDADDPNTVSFQRALGFFYQPEFYLLDANGNLLKKFVGAVSQNEFSAEFDQYIR